MELLQLRYFRSIARCQSVTRAEKNSEFSIRHVSITQSSGKGIRDIKLFDRKTTVFIRMKMGVLF